MPLSKTLPVPVIEQLVSNRSWVVLFAPVVFTTIVPLLFNPVALAIASVLPGTRLSLAGLAERLSAPIWNPLDRLEGAAIEIVTSNVLLFGT